MNEDVTQRKGICLATGNLISSCDGNIIVDPSKFRLCNSLWARNLNVLWFMITVYLVRRIYWNVLLNWIELYTYVVLFKYFQKIKKECCYQPWPCHVLITIEALQLKKKGNCTNIYIDHTSFKKTSPCPDVFDVCHNLYPLNCKQMELYWCTVKAENN